MSYGQKVLLICKIYVSCIYFSLNKNYQKKVGIPSKSTKLFRKSFSEFPQKFCGKKQNLFGFRTPINWRLSRRALKATTTFVRSFAVGRTAARWGSFEIEYKSKQN